jgi:DNA uptake protein ComE-like DNA-binding protein
MNCTPSFPALGRWIAAACVAAGFMVCAAPSIAAGHPSPAARKASAPVAAVKRIDINSASREQLKTLHGIGDVEADKIIAGRPWPTKARLVGAKVLPMGIYLSIKNLIVASQPSNTPAKTKGS